MTSIENKLLALLMKSVDSNAFWRMIDKLLMQTEKLEVARRNAARIEILKLNDKLVQRRRWPAREHTHASYRRSIT